MKIIIFIDLNVDLPTMDSKQKIRLHETKICQEQITETTLYKRKSKCEAY